MKGMMALSLLVTAGFCNADTVYVEFTDGTAQTGQAALSGGPDATWDTFGAGPVFGLTFHDWRNSRTSIGPHWRIITYPLSLENAFSFYDRIFLMRVRCRGFTVLCEERSRGSLDGDALVVVRLDSDGAIGGGDCEDAGCGSPSQLPAASQTLTWAWIRCSSA
jgi:hypothetical protein